MKLSQSYYSAGYDSGMWANNDGNGGYNTGRQAELKCAAGGKRQSLHLQRSSGDGYFRSVEKVWLADL